MGCTDSLLFSWTNNPSQPPPFDFTIKVGDPQLEVLLPHVSIAKYAITGLPEVDKTTECTIQSYSLLSITRDGIADATAASMNVVSGTSPSCLSMVTTDVKMTVAGATAPQGFKESVIEFQVEAMVSENNVVRSLYTANLFKITITCNGSSFITSSVNEFIVSDVSKSKSII